MADTVRTRHEISGQIDENTPRHILEHPVLGRHLQVVGPDVKPYLPEMHKTPKNAEEADSRTDSAPSADVKFPEVTPKVIAKEREAEANHNKNGKV